MSPSAVTGNLRFLARRCGIQRRSAWPVSVRCVHTAEHSQAVAAAPSLLNTLTGQLASLPTPQSGPLHWYSCGPTVYDSAHLGHARTYICLDVARRILTDLSGYNIVYAMGITDVDDKIIKRGQDKGAKTNEDFLALASAFENEFMEDMDSLGVRRPDAMLRVTEHLPEIVQYIQGIEKNGLAYATDHGLYFDVAAMGDNYGRLGVRAMEDWAEGAQPDPSASTGRKRSQKDFALWKTAKPGEPSWDSPWGRGRPGWHIECSAMTHALFGAKVDIHSGGVDLKFPHHTNEIAQCEAHNCSAHWVKYWLHTGHLYIAGAKMSKSLKNFVTIRKFLEDWGQKAGGTARAAEDYRIFCLMHKYNASVTFGEDSLVEAKNIRTRLERFLALAQAAAEGGRTEGTAPRRWGEREHALSRRLTDTRSAVHAALGNDFDTPSALRHLVELAGAASGYLDAAPGVVPEPPSSAAAYVASMLGTLGLAHTAAFFKGGPASSAAGTGGPAPEQVITALADFRSQVRSAAIGCKAPKNDVQAQAAAGQALKRRVLSLCDEVRDKRLRELGVALEDKPDMTSRWLLVDPKAQGQAKREE